VIAGFRRCVRSSLFYVVAKGGLIVISDVSGQPIRPIFKDQVELFDPRRWEGYVAPRRR